MSSVADDVAACGSAWRTSAPETRRGRGRAPSAPPGANACNPASEEFGEERLRDLVRRHGRDAEVAVYAIWRETEACSKRSAAASQLLGPVRGLPPPRRRHPTSLTKAVALTARCLLAGYPTLPVPACTPRPIPPLHSQYTAASQPLSSPTPHCPRPKLPVPHYRRTASVTSP